MNMKKLNMYFYAAIAALTIVAYSCNDLDESLFENNNELINAISDAEKQEVSIEELPISIQEVVESEFANEEVINAYLAPGLGYELSLISSTGLELGAVSEAYFGLQGNYLSENGEGPQRRRKGRRPGPKCFEFVFPITFTMPDGSELTLEDKEGFRDVHEWYKSNPDYIERPDVQFPVDIIFDGDSLVTITSEEEWVAVHDHCQAMREELKCFSFVYPISFTMADESVITLETSDDFSLLREWHEANPDLRGKPELNFPVDVVFDDGEILTIDSREALHELRRTCRAETING